MHRVAVFVNVAIGRFEYRPTCSIHEATAAETKNKQDSIVQLAYFGASTQSSHTALDHNLRATITSNAALSHLFAQPLLLSFTHSGLVIIIITLAGSCHGSRTSQRSCRPQSSRRHPSLRRHALGKGGMGRIGSRVLSLLRGVVGGIVGDWRGGLAL
jgi:hypothetical protein